MSDQQRIAFWERQEAEALAEASRARAAGDTEWYRMMIEQAAGDRREWLKIQARAERKVRA